MEDMKVVALAALVGWPCLVFGRWCQDWCNKELGTASWRTWNFLGNAGRGPIYTWSETPFHEDFEEVVKYRRDRQDL